jgi:hypothetical protein
VALKLPHDSRQSTGAGLYGHARGGSKGDEITLSPASPAVGQQTDIAPAVQISPHFRMKIRLLICNGFFVEVRNAETARAIAQSLLSGLRH